MNTNIEELYKQKYLKYKAKYLNIQRGGVNYTTFDGVVTQKPVAPLGKVVKMFILSNMTAKQMDIGLLGHMATYDNEIAYYETININTYKYYTSNIDVLRWFLTNQNLTENLKNNNLQPLANRPPNKQ